MSLETVISPDVLSESSENMEKERTNLKRMIIVLAPDLVDLPRLIHNMRRYTLSHRMAQIQKLHEMAEKGRIPERETEKYDKCFEVSVSKLQRILEAAKEEINFTDEGEKQACMWLICTLFCEDGRRSNGKYREIKEPNEENVYYAGLGFGEFWALTYRMYRKGQISFKEAVWQAKNRGIRMSLVAEKYYSIFVREKNREKLYRLFPKKHGIGILALHQGRYHLYGRECELQSIAKRYQAEMQESLPYFSRHLEPFARAYARRFPHAEEAVDSQIITDKNVKSVKELVEQQICYWEVRQKLRQKIASYAPFYLMEI